MRTVSSRVRLLTTTARLARRLKSLLVAARQSPMRYMPGDRGGARRRNKMSFAREQCQVTEPSGDLPPHRDTVSWHEVGERDAGVHGHAAGQCVFVQEVAIGVGVGCFTFTKALRPGAE